jgi:hypothetical protein
MDQGYTMKGIGTTVQLSHQSQPDIQFERPRSCAVVDRQSRGNVCRFYAVQYTSPCSSQIKPLQVTRRTVSELFSSFQIHTCQLNLVLPIVCKPCGQCIFHFKSKPSCVQMAIWIVFYIKERVCPNCRILNLLSLSR